MDTNSVSVSEKLDNKGVLSQIVEQSPVLIIMTDLDGNIVFVNKMFEKVTGYSKDEAIGKNPRILKSGYTPDEEYEDFWNTISSGKTWEGRFHNIKKDGSFYWASAMVAPFKAPDGKITNYIGIQQDVTEEVEAKKNLEKRMAELERLNKMLVGRELKMNELKKENEKLRTQIGINEKNK